MEDTYRLFLSPTNTYQNAHRSIVWSCFADGRFAAGNQWALTWRTGAEDESLRSNRLGDQSRLRGTLLVVPEWQHARVKIAGGGKIEVFTDDEPAYLPQAGVEYAWHEGVELYGAYSGTVRQPSYTELNYESPGSLGNKGLPRQKARNFEGGIRVRGERVSCRAAAFLLVSDHTVDWVKLDASAPRWEAVDLGCVATRGFEIECGYSGEGFSSRCGYTILDKSSDTEPYASRYTLDYPEHLAQLAATWRIARQWQIAATQAVRRQTENPVRSGGRTGFPATIHVHMAPRISKFLELTMAVENVWNDDFETYPGLPSVPRRFSVAATVAW